MLFTKEHVHAKNSILAPAQTFKRKILEVFYIRKLKPLLNSQKDIKITQLFKNGMTWIPESEILTINWFYVYIIYFIVTFSNDFKLTM